MPLDESFTEGLFPVTRWTLVQALQSDDEKDAGKAMEALCQHYWYPIYAFLRRTGYRAPDAEDLTQEFFRKLVSGTAMDNARQDVGKLRSYLLGILKRQISDKTRHDHAQKRGGGRVHVSFDTLEAAERYALEPLNNHDPEWLFTRAWAQDLLAGVREKLRNAYEAAGREGVFDILLPFLMWDKEPPSHREIAARIGSSEAGSRIQIHRLRIKFRDLLRDEVALTVLSPEDIPEEMAWLKDVLAGQ